MSKATRMAGALDGFADALPAYGFDPKPLRNTAAHLRALEANRQMLVHALENCRSVMVANGLGSAYSAQLADAALEQAKELT